MDIVHVEYKPDSNPNVVDFIDNELAAMNQLYSAVDDRVLSNFHAEPIGLKEILPAQRIDTFCTEIRRKLNQGNRYSKWTMMAHLYTRSSKVFEVLPRSLWRT